MDLMGIAFFAIVGGLTAALLGYLESKKAFNPKKFGASCLRAVIAGVVFAVGYHFSNGITALDLLWAFLGGAGVDVVGNRFMGTVRRNK